MIKGFLFLGRDLRMSTALTPIIRIRYCRANAPLTRGLAADDVGRAALALSSALSAASTGLFCFFFFFSRMCSLTQRCSLNRMCSPIRMCSLTGDLVGRAALALSSATRLPLPQAHTHTHTHTHIRIHTYTHTHTPWTLFSPYTYTHTHTHTHTHRHVSER